ncbi:MAG TPA: EAL domain-containing protein [Acidimicrobiales bacterium]|nr:EAL domain-containing protein [Acidimicrobiales bacterium]
MDADGTVTAQKRSPVVDYMALVFDSEGRVVSGTPLAARLVGYVPGARMGDALGGDGRPADPVAVLVERSRRLERVAPHVATCVLDDGSELDVELSSAPLLGADGELSGVIVVLCSLHARRSGAIRATPSRLQELLEASGAFVWELDLESRAATWWAGGGATGSGLEQSPRGAAGTGAGADLATRRPAPGPSDRERVVASALAALEAAPGGVATHRVTMSDGKDRWYALSAEFLVDDAGRAVRMQGMALDVTREQEALERLRLHSQHSHELVVRVRTGSRAAFEYVSPACEYFTGYSADELYEGGIAYALGAVDPPTVARMREDVRSGSLDGKTYEFPTRRRDGAVLWVRAVFRQIEDDTGEVILEITVRDVAQRKALEIEVARLRLTDMLTGVASRQSLEERWPGMRDRAIATGSWTAVVHLDIDRFGLVNSGLGIAAGDDLLRSVAHRLTESVTGSDLVVRLGSDDFVVVVGGIETRADALAVAGRLADAFHDPVRTSGRSTFVAVSVGASILPARPWSLEDGLDVRLGEAEAAMRVVKARGGNGVEVFAEEMRTEARDKVEILAALRDGIESEELVLHFQPIVDVRSGAVAAAEALVRWQHPTRGLLGPGEFVGLAEETGWIVPIGGWVLERACAVAARWPAVHARRVKVAVNLSARQLSSVDLVGAVAAAIDRTGLDPDDLVLEITETAFIHDFDAAVWTLRRMGDLGVHLALDDFGTGYSSLAYLVQLPIDRVKIDRSMVSGLHRDPHSRAVVAGIIGMTDALGIETIAEGVETIDQLRALRSLGCNLAQGYHFSKAIPEAAFENLLRAPPRW